MGNSTSTSKEKKQEEIIDTKNNVDAQTNKQLEQKKNLEKIMPKEEKDNDTTEILESLDITEFKKPNEKEPDEKEPNVKEPNEKEHDKKEQIGGKKSIPLLGGFGVNLSETSDDILGGFENKTGRKRYTKYDLFKILRELDVDTEAHQQGGGNDEGDDETDVKSSLNDEKSMEHIKNIILKELETLKTNKSQQLGGSGCGCNGSGNKNTRKLSSKLNLNNIIIDNEGDKQLGGTVLIDASSSSTTSDDSESSSSSDHGYDKSKKSKSTKSSKSLKKNQSQESSDSDSHFHIDTTESGLNDKGDQTSNGGGSDEKTESEKSSEIKRKTKDKTDSEDGLSIFPFNSSDVKSSVSIKNYRMLRRKI